MGGVTMVSVPTDELQKVVETVAGWPAHDRITLARKILQTVEETSTPVTRGMRAEEVIELLKMPQPAPDDAACDQIVEEERLRKYGK